MVIGDWFLTRKLVFDFCYSKHRRSIEGPYPVSTTITYKKTATAAEMATIENQSAIWIPYLYKANPL